MTTKKEKHWRWGDIRYIDPATSYICSGGIDGKPEHAPMNMIMGNADVVLVCPICDTIYGNKERMNGRSVQARINEADRIKQENARLEQQEVDRVNREQGFFSFLKRRK